MSGYVGQQIKAWLAGAVLIWIVWQFCPPLGMFCAAILVADRVIWLALLILGLCFGLGVGAARLGLRMRGRPSDNDVLLNRAARPAGLLAAALTVESLWWPGTFRHAAAVFLHNPAGYWLAALLVAAALIYAVAAFAVALRRCTNPRDGAVMRAALAIILGVAVACWLQSLPPASAGPLAGSLQVAAIGGGLLAAVWIAATATVRLVLLVIDGGGVLRLIGVDLRQRNAPMRAGRW